MASKAGGMEIEKVAEETPELILKEIIEPGLGLTAFQARKLAFGLGLPSDLVNPACGFMMKLYQAFESTDASLAEINPFLLTEDAEFKPLDVPVVLVPGNHDNPAPAVKGRAQDVDGRIIEVNGLRLAGIGGQERARPAQGRLHSWPYRSRSGYSRGRPS
jgi:Icc-related predicted phosphoesterase